MNILSPLDAAAAAPLATILAAAAVPVVVGSARLRLLRLTLMLAAVVAALLMVLGQFAYRGQALQNLVLIDAHAAIFGVILVAAALLGIFLTVGQFAGQRVASGQDVHALMLFTLLGALVMISAAHAFVFFLGFELLSLSAYAMTAGARDERASAEAGLKYFVLGAFSSAFMLYGMVLLYGSTGTLAFSELVRSPASSSVLFQIGLSFLLFGFGFKLALVPFHLWTPDVYQGAPTAVTGYMAAIVKAAVFGVFIRIAAAMAPGANPAPAFWNQLLWLVSLASMLLGNFAALKQSGVKRMLAYSSIAHAGYIMMGVLALGTGGYSAVAFYLAAYVLMTLCAFGGVLLATAGTSAQYDRDSLEALSGFGWKHPYIGAALALSVLSLAGFPPLAGFFAKLYVFAAALKSGYSGLVIIAALSSLVALYYYLRVLVVMYFRSPEESALDFVRSAPLPTAGLALLSLGIICLGFFSESCLTLLRATGL